METSAVGTQPFSIRPAEEKDAGLLLQLIRELARYEGMEEQVVATEEGLRQSIFRRGRAGALIARLGEEPVGFALYFFNFSTFLGREGLYLEDLFIRQEYRGRGFGKALFRALATLACQNGCGRMEWWCLDWNTPSIGFYKALGAQPMQDWTVYRLTAPQLRALAAGQPAAAATPQEGGGSGWQ